MSYILKLYDLFIESIDNIEKKDNNNFYYLYGYDIKINDIKNVIKINELIKKYHIDKKVVVNSLTKSINYEKKSMDISFKEYRKYFNKYKDLKFYKNRFDVIK